MSGGGRRAGKWYWVRESAARSNSGYWVQESANAAPGAGYWVPRGRRGAGDVIEERADVEGHARGDRETEAARVAMRARDSVLLLTVLAASFLFMAFGLNWEVNPDAFHVVEMSTVLQGLGPVESSVVALAVAAFIVALPEAGRRLPFEPTPLRVAAMAGAMLLLVYWVAGGPQQFLVVLIQTFVLVFYSAPLVFGLYGTFHRRPVHLVIASMFMFFTMGGAARPSQSDWPALLASAVLFLLFIEVSDTSIRCWNLHETRKLPDDHLVSFVDHYLRHMALFMSMGVLLTIFIIQLPMVVGALGLRALAASLELGSVYGQMTSAVVVLGGLAALRFLHDRGYTAPWIGRARRLWDYLRGRRRPAETAY